jgi:hypothetical protein
MILLKINHPYLRVDRHMCGGGRGGAGARRGPGGGQCGIATDE